MAMSKKTVYSLFVAKFVFSLAMIFWTIKMTLGAGVGTDDDNTFQAYYHDVDANYNEIVVDNHKFAALYNIDVKINDYKLDSLDYNDIYLSQRVIDKRTDRKNILNVGDSNSVEVKVYDKNTNELVTSKSLVVFTMPSTHKYDQKVEISDKKQSNVKIEKKSYWNINGSIEVNGLKGHFYIKTNAI